MATPREVLNVSEGADLEQCRAAYRRLAKLWHPDRNPGDEVAAAKFKEVEAAWDELNGRKASREADEGREKVVSCLRSLLVATVGEMISRGQEPSQHDVHGKMRAQLADMLRQANDNSRECKKQRLAVLKMIGRWKGDDGVMDEVLQAKVAEMDAALSGIAADVARLTATIELLDRWRFDYEKVKYPSGATDYGSLLHTLKKMTAEFARK